jgi:hypothetical protein
MLASHSGDFLMTFGCQVPCGFLPNKCLLDKKKAHQQVIFML